MEGVKTVKVHPRAGRCGHTANAHRSAGKVTLTVDGEAVAAVDEDEHQHASARRDNLGPEEGEEEFSLYNTWLCGRIGGSCCT